MNQSYLLIILVVIVGYFGYDYHSFFNDSTSPLLLKQDENKALEDSIAEKKKKKEETIRFFDTLKTKQQEVTTLVEQLSQMKQTLSENSDVSGFSKFLFTEAKKIGLNLSSLQPMPRAPKQYYEEIPFQITFSGMYVQVIAFLERVSQADRIVKIESISLKPKSGQSLGTKFVELDGSAIIKTFMYLGTNEDDMGKDSFKSTANPKASQTPSTQTPAKVEAPKP